MKLNVSKNVNYLGWIIIIIAFGFLYFSYFFIYIPKQEKKLQQRAFRILKEYGNNMFDKNNYYKNHFENYRLYYALRHHLNSEKIVRGDLTRKENIDRFNEINKVINSLNEYVDCQTNNGEKTDTPFVFSEQKNLLLINYNVFLTDTVNEDFIKSVERIYTPSNSFKKTNYSFADILKQPIMYKVPIDTFMSGLKFDRLFENIILFDTSRVYYNSRNEFVSDITRPKALCDSVEIHQGGIREKLEIRGIDKQVMIIPIDYYGKRFYLAGLISDDDFKAKTRTIDSQFLILIAVLLLLVLIGMPILKIIFIGKNERLKSKDASASILSSIFGTGLLILIIIGIIKHQFVDHPLMKERIIRISNQLYQNVSNDINSIKNLYIKINSVKNNDSEFARFVKQHFNHGNKKFQQYGDTILNGLFPINEVILIDSKGIIDSAVTSTPFSELVPINLSHRQYFINAVDTNKAWETENGLMFYIESIKSYNTGAGETSVSFHNEGNTSAPVTAITSAIPSLYRQVLPRDVEFLIINNSGKVLYHSIKSKNLHENFLDEVDFDVRLQNAIELRTEEIIHIDYNEKEWLVRIIPMQNTPLFHITLIDLDQMNNTNARIFMFTFYFLIVTLLIIGIGMLLMRWIVPSEEFNKSKRWFLSWILFDAEKYQVYKRISWILTVIIVLQLLGVWVSLKPLTLLLFHVIFIAFTSFVVLILLKRRKLKFQKIFSTEYFPENIILAVVITLEVLFVWKFSYNWKWLLPVSATIFITLCLPFILQLKKTSKPKIIKRNTKVRMYLFFLLLWVMSLSVIPVIQFYYSVKQQEEIIRRQEQHFTIASKNLELQKDYTKYGKDPWFYRIQGNGIDNLQVRFESGSDFSIPNSVKPSNDIRFADEIYAWLPEPVSITPKLNLFKNDSNYINREWIKSDKFYYSLGGEKGTISVSSGIFEKNFADFMLWILRFYLILIGFFIIMWFLLKYVASILFNLNLEKPDVKHPDWLNVLCENKNTNRIILQSFNPEYFLKLTSETIQKNKNEKFGKLKPVLIKTQQLADKDFNYKKYLSSPDNIIWITGLEQLIYDIHSHEIFFDRMQEINRKAYRVVMELPFDLDFIDETYDRYNLMSKDNFEKMNQIAVFKKKWKIMFANYVEFNGYIADTNDPGDSHLALNSATFESDTQFLSIWNNLTNYEKIVLFDLAGDGLLNIKNTSMINQLYRKKLIELNPYPELCSPEFKNFINRNMTSDSIQDMEKELGIKGKWKNTQYLILLILIPLAAFILISQGLSIEKIFGIFAGVLTIITGAMKLFDSNLFKTAE